MAKKGVSIWDYIAWGVLICILIWLVLKTIGLIKTPVLIEYAPYFGAVYLAGWAMHKLESTIDDIQELKQDFKESEKNLRI